MSSVSDKTFIRARAIPGTLRFIDWPLRDDPLRSGLLLLLLIAASWFASHSAQDAAVGALAFVLAALTLRRLWIPTVYELGSKGIVLSRFGRKRRIPWSEVGRVEFH